MKSPGIVIRPLREITGDELFNEVFFDDVFVPDEMVVGDVNDGWRLARTTLANERVAMAQGTALGNPMEELLRVVREDPDLEVDGAQQDRLGSLIVTAQVGSLLDQRIAQLAVVGQDPGPQASARKLIGVRYRQALAEFRMELSEGAGAVENQQVHDFLNTRCLTIAGGTEQILLTMAGERLLGLPRLSWSFLVARTSPRGSLVVGDFDRIGPRVRLARQDQAFVEVLLLEHVVDLHLDVAGLGYDRARAAVPFAAGERRVQALVEQHVEQFGAAWPRDFVGVSVERHDRRRGALVTVVCVFRQSPLQRTGRTPRT